MAWLEFDGKMASQVYVKRWEKEAWIGTGGSLNVDKTQNALTPSVEFKGDTPYVTWVESDTDGITQIQVKHWNGSVWVKHKSSLNLDPLRAASAPSMAILQGRPHVAWKESGEDGIFRIVVKAAQ